jgi:hypothetical protein
MNDVPLSYDIDNILEGEADGTLIGVHDASKDQCNKGKDLTFKEMLDD